MQIINQPQETSPARRVYYLYPGQIITGVRPTIIKTTLGSCVAVCLWDSHLKIGGMNHFMTPEWSGRNDPTAIYGDIAIRQLVMKMQWLGAVKGNLKAKIFGGAEGLDQTRYPYKVGSKNIIKALEMLEELKIPVAARSLGGSEGRNLLFYTDTGKAELRFIRKTVYQWSPANPGAIG